MEPDRYDVLVVGGGAAGLAAALGAAEAAQAAGARISIGLLERADEDEAGGNTRWSPAYMRLESPQRLAPRFVDDMLDLSNQRSDPRSIARLAAEATATLAWIEGHGVSFHTPKTYFLTAAAPRIQPVGGGASLVRELSAAAVAAGVDVRYRATAQRIVVGADGRIAGVEVQRADESVHTLACDALILACGGFEMDPTLMARTFGPGAEAMRPISPGTRFNRGDGIRMALALGAQASGDWNGLHAEPVDPRATNAEAVVLVYPYGLLVNQRGQRFVDEASGRVDETWEIFARQIFFEQPGRIAYVILDQRLLEIASYQRAIRSDVEPLRAETLEGLAAQIGVDAPALRATIEAYNAAAPSDETAFDATRLDGLRTRDGYAPPKSNWARRIDRPPYLAYPVVCAIAYTFGGIATNEQAEVLGADGAPIPGLYAAGEITGLYYGKAPGGTSVLRGLVFGRIAGGRAIDFCAGLRYGTPDVSTAAVHTVRTPDDVALAYHLRGADRGEGGRLVLIHSLGLSHLVWEAVAERLAKRAAVLIYDCRGHGGSGKPAGPYTLDLFASDLAVLLDHLGWETAVVGGCSLGGSVALRFASAYPARVAALGLVDTTAWYGPDAVTSWHERAERARNEGLPSMVGFQETRWFSDAFRAAQPELVARCRETFLANDVAAFAASCEMLGAFDLRATLGAIAVPTAVVVGEEDYATPPAMARALHDAIAGSSLEIIAAGRHITPVERPDALAQTFDVLLDRVAR